MRVAGGDQAGMEPALRRVCVLLQSCWPTLVPSLPSTTSAGRWGRDAAAAAAAPAPALRTQAWSRKTQEKEMATGAEDEVLPSGLAL